MLNNSTSLKLLYVFRSDVLLSIRLHIWLSIPYPKKHLKKKKSPTLYMLMEATPLFLFS